MGQPFRLLVTGSRTWDDAGTIEQALAVILDRHPEGVLLVHGACPAEPTRSLSPTRPGPRAIASRRISRTGTATGELPDTGGTPR
jgi:YspA, cpYpsA-related SLOG family